MKKLIKLLLCSILLISETAFSQDIKSSLHLGLSTYSLKTTDFNNFTISDWQQYGLKLTDPTSYEGRVRIPLSNSARDNNFNLSLLAGVNVYLTDKFDYLLDVNFSKYDGTIKLNFMTGIDYSLYNKNNFKIGFTPKIGICWTQFHYGEIQLIDGYTAPVIIDNEKTFTNGDKLYMNIFSFGLQVGITPKYKINSKTSIFAQIGFEKIFSGDVSVIVEKADKSKVEINMTDASVVKDDYTATQANFKPSVSMQGLYFQLGVEINLDK